MNLKNYQVTELSQLSLFQITDGVQNVIVYPSANDKSKNRGFAFVEYDSHRSAAMARRKLLRQVLQCNYRSETGAEIDSLFPESPDQWHSSLNKTVGQ